MSENHTRNKQHQSYCADDGWNDVPEKAIVGRGSTRGGAERIANQRIRDVEVSISNTLYVCQSNFH